ncbi:DUF3558 family protein [Demequina aurantiaca]|uniref:DUF3558 family protein n=1 Tax=Demequina aurantiaca TaxID=676200 RepID=UPI003D346427
MALLTRTALAGTTVTLALMLAACSGGEDTADPAAPASTASGAATAAAPESTAAAETPAEPAAEEENLAASGLPDVCALLSPAEIEAATGMAVGEGLAEADRQTSFSALCEWTQSDGDSFVAVAIAPGYPIPYEDGVDDATAISVAGASEAYTVRTGVTMGMLVDGDYVAVTFNGPYDGEQGGGAIAIAEAVAANLG